MSLKIVFMGTPEFAVPCLELLKKSEHEIQCVYSQPPSKANRGQKLVSPAVEIYAKKYSLKLRNPINLDTDEEYNFLSQIKPDLVVVVAYGKIIPKRFLKLPKHSFINVHASLLPKWRGAAPIQRSIMNLDKETGISIMKIVERLDEGPILLQNKIRINENISSLSLSKVLSKLGAKSLINSIDLIEKGEAKYNEQNNEEATYAKKISKSESQIIWNDKAEKILAKINGLNPNPGAWFEYNNQRYKVWKAKVINESGEVGKIINDKLIFYCKDKSIQILEIQKEGKIKQSSEKFLVGNKL
tara:strand:+ start:16344 stop:17243 length:900 start_codon:yes stop_codon:yes gene_type:complete